jgi:LacI family transcriptional regulator
VFVDEEALARMALGHFRLLQRRHYAFCGRAGALATRERAEAFQRLMEPPEETFARRDITVEQAVESARTLDEMLRALPLPACLLCYEDRIAERVLERCAELDLAVPGDLAVLSCGDDPLLSSLGESALSSIVFPSGEIGRAAARVLDRLLRGEPAEHRIYRVEPEELRIRDSTDPAASADPVLARALDFMRTRAGQPIAVEDVARAAGVSRRSLEVRFRDKLQKTVHRQLREMRMEKARGLIRSSNRAMEEIALECGFSSAATFSRAFHDWFGHAPSLLRGAR